MDCEKLFRDKCSVLSERYTQNKLMYGVVDPCNGLFQ